MKKDTEINLAQLDPLSFEYEIKGVTLNSGEMYEIAEYYEAHCTAEYIADNYLVSSTEAIELGYEVRRRMNKYGGDEDEVVVAVMREWEEETDQKLVEHWADLQDNGVDLPCPRCFAANVGLKDHTAAVSRREDIHVCSFCGTAEALEDENNGIGEYKAWGVEEMTGWKMFSRLSEVKDALVDAIKKLPPAPRSRGMTLRTENEQAIFEAATALLARIESEENANA